MRRKLKTTSVFFDCNIEIEGDEMLVRYKKNLLRLINHLKKNLEDGNYDIIEKDGEFGLSHKNNLKYGK